MFSRTLRQNDHPDVIVVSGDVPALLAELRSGPGRDIWLFGGGELFRSLLALGGVDTVEPAVIPVLLGGGRPLLPEPSERCRLTLTGHTVFPKTGTVLLSYDVAGQSRRKRGAAT